MGVVVLPARWSMGDVSTPQAYQTLCRSTVQVDLGTRRSFPFAGRRSYRRGAGRHKSVVGTAAGTPIGT